MKMKTRAPVLLLGLLFSIVLVSGCARKANIISQALDFNKSVQQHRLDTLFLNVLRAAHREPMAMTTISGVTTTNTSSAGGSLGFKIGPLSPGPYSAAFDTRVQQQPTVQLQILDNDENFVKGFMNPVDEKTIDYFLNQGWRPELLAYLLIESIDGRLEEFGPEERAEILRHSKVPPQGEIRVKNEPNNAMFSFLITKHVRNLRLSPNGFRIVTSTVRSRTRSPQGILYYLGELARVSLHQEDGEVPIVDGKPLFLVREGPKTSLESSVCVDFRGRFYYIPNDPPNRSLSTLTLVQQLVNMQTKKVQPATQTIQLIGN